MDQQAFEQQKLQWQTDIKLLNEQSVVQRDKISVLQKQNGDIGNNCALIEKNNSELQLMLKQTEASLKEMEKSQQEYLQSKQHWQNQFYEIQKTLENKTMESAHLQTELKMTLQRLKETEKSWQDTQYQLKLSADEKWIVAQEKAQLEGQLKQMEKRVAV